MAHSRELKFAVDRTSIIVTGFNPFEKYPREKWAKAHVDKE